MGTTRATLHLACAHGERLQEQLISAGRQLGWSPATTGEEPGPKQRIAVHHAPGAQCATVALAGNDRIDDGTLKDLAVVLSRETGMPAAVTGLYDSDAFDMILYADGKQLDAIGSSGDEQNNELARIDAAERGSIWSSLFQRPLGPAPAPPESPFAEDALDALLAWIGIDPGTAHLSYDEFAERTGEDGNTTLLVFDEATPPASHERGKEGRSPPILTPYHDDDDCRSHRVYPAPWPVPPGEASGLTWLIRSSGAGFDGARVTFKVDDASGASIRSSRLSIHAYPFFNGQITSGTAAASFEAKVTGTLDEGVWSHDAPSFVMPDLDPEARKDLLIVLRLEFMPEAGATARLQPMFQPYGCGDTPVALPPVRILGGNMDWRPNGKYAWPLGGAYEKSLLLEINTPSILSLVAIHDGDTDDIRASVRSAAEEWLGSLTRAAECSAAVLTKKHMTASGSITKKRMELPLADLTAEAAWKRWFSDKTDLQTLRVEVIPRGAFQPYAGLVMQAALKDIPVAGDPESTEQPALHTAFWTVDHPDAWAAIGLERQVWLDQLEEWIERSDVLQACRMGSAGIPIFDSYENYEETTYEALSGVDWFRSGLRGKLMSEAWCSETLRFVAPRMWLGQSLAARLAAKTSKLNASAEVSTLPKMTRVSLKNGVPIAKLERALSPILPRVR